MCTEFPKRSQGCISGCSGTMFTLSSYDIKTSSRGRSFPPGGEPRKIRVLCDYFMCLCFAYVLSVICYMNVAYQLMDVCMLCFSL